MEFEAFLFVQISISFVFVGHIWIRKFWFTISKRVCTMECGCYFISGAKFNLIQKHKLIRIVYMKSFLFLAATDSIRGFCYCIIFAATIMKIWMIKFWFLSNHARYLLSLPLSIYRSLSACFTSFVCRHVLDVWWDEQNRHDRLIHWHFPETNWNFMNIYGICYDILPYELIIVFSFGEKWNLSTVSRAKMWVCVRGRDKCLPKSKC